MKELTASHKMKKLVSFAKNLQSGFCGFLQWRLIKVWIPSRGAGRIKELVFSFKWWETFKLISPADLYKEQLLYLYSNNNDTVHSYGMHQLRISKCLGACWALLPLLKMYHLWRDTQQLLCTRAGRKCARHPYYIFPKWGLINMPKVKSRERLGTWMFPFVGYLSWPR